MASRDVNGTLAYLVAPYILAESAELLRSLSSGVRESVVLWTGVQRTNTAEVRRVTVPEQRAHRRGFEIPLAERLEIIQELASSGETILAQLHTHPGRAFHSRTDDRLALPRHTGAISIVIANFALGWDGDLQNASVNLHLGAGRWRELSGAEVTNTFEVTNAAQ